MRELKLYFCPRCKSHEVRAMFSWRNVFGMFPRWICKKCGFQAMMFPIAVYPKNHRFLVSQKSKKSQDFSGDKRKLEKLNMKKKN